MGHVSARSQLSDVCSRVSDEFGLNQLFDDMKTGGDEMIDSFPRSPQGGSVCIPDVLASFLEEVDIILIYSPCFSSAGCKMNSLISF